MSSNGLRVLCGHIEFVMPGIRLRKFIHDLETFSKERGPYLPSAEDIGVVPISGRLGQSIEGGGSRNFWRDN